VFHPRARTKDLAWIRPDGGEMTMEDWADQRNHVLGMLIRGEASDDVDDRGRPVFGETVLLLLNGGPRSRHFTLPRVEGRGVWRELLNTAHPGPPRPVKAPALKLLAFSLLLLRFGEQP